MVPEGVAIRVITSQSMVLSGEGAKVSEMTPRKSESPFLTFSVAPEEPSALFEAGGSTVSETSQNFWVGSLRKEDLSLWGSATEQTGLGGCGGRHLLQRGAELSFVGRTQPGLGWDYPSRAEAHSSCGQPVSPHSDTAPVPPAQHRAERSTGTFLCSSKGHRVTGHRGMALS